jgi:hypothetical protein
MKPLLVGDGMVWLVNLRRFTLKLNAFHSKKLKYLVIKRVKGQIVKVEHSNKGKILISI